MKETNLSALVFGGATLLVGFAIWRSIPRAPVVTVQTVPAVCSSTAAVYLPPTPEACAEQARKTVGELVDKGEAILYTPETLIPAIVGRWRSADGAVTLQVDEPRSANSKKPAYHLRLTLPKDPPELGFGCDFMIDGTVFDSGGPHAGKLQYRAWCRDHKDARVFLKLDQDELSFALEVETAMKVTTVKLVKIP